MSIKSYMVMAVFSVMLLSAVAYAETCDVNILVLDKYGDPVEDATVKITNSSDTWSENTVGDGFVEDKFELDCNDDDFEYDYDIEVTHDDYQDFVRDNFIEDLDVDADIAVVMRPSLVDFELTIIDDSDDTIDNADVEISCDEEDRGHESDFRDYDSDYENFDFIFMDKDGDSASKYKGFDYNDDGESDEGDITFSDIESNTSCDITVSKSNYEDITVTLAADIGKDIDGNDGKIELIKPGEVEVTITVTDDSSLEPVSGVTVVVANHADPSEEKRGTTNAQGIVEFTLDTPASYDYAFTKEKYIYTGTPYSDRYTGDSTSSFTISITAQNNAPEANASDDVFVTENTTVTLDASGSSDSDGDELTYAWEDSAGTEIPNGVSPSIILPVGEHVITLTVSDGEETDTDSVTVLVEALANCGDGTCSAAENALDNCPQDCPTCLDSICGAGESDYKGGNYCPVDCGISAVVLTTNTTDFVPGNTTVLVSVDSRSGERLGGVLLSIEAPNGTVSILRTDENGQATYTFTESGNYNVSASKDMYSPSERLLIVLGGGMDITWIVVGVVIVVVAVLGGLFLIRTMNMRKRGGSGWSKQGKFRRKKPSLKA